jgi:hypothetical protein
MKKTSRSKEKEKFAWNSPKMPKETRSVDSIRDSIK